MKLLTKEILKKLPPLYANENLSPEETKVIVKFFNPCGAATWYATEFEPETGTFFGYVNLGNRDFAELGYFSLEELEAIRLPGGLGIERDIHFGYEHSLADVMNNRL
jgi:hypothetical protein